MLLLFSILACCSYSQFLHAALILSSCMLHLFSILACCPYSQILPADLILNSCLLILFSIPACCSYFQLLLLLFVNSFALYFSISAPLVLKFCCSCFVNPDVINFKNRAALILWKNPAALVTKATALFYNSEILFLILAGLFLRLLLSISVLLFLTSWLCLECVRPCTALNCLLGSLTRKMGRCTFLFRCSYRR